MPNAYDNSAAAEDFARFLASEDGQMQQDILYENIVPFIQDKSARVLDAACGQGWLTGRLKHQFNNIEAFDSSQALIDQAKRNYPEINFQIADATNTLPYQDSQFDIVILNMAASDLSDLPTAFANFNAVLKPGGKMIMTLANPYYSFPVGVWKRGIIGRVLNRLPQLKLRSYHQFKKQKSQLQNWRGQLSSYFYPLAEYINQALAAGFELRTMQELESAPDDAKFNVRHQLHRFPLILLFVFEKRGK